MDVNNMELAVGDVNLPKVKAAVAKAIATKNLSIINKTAAELEDLTGFFKKLNIDHDILVALIKQLRLLIEQEIDLRYLENLKFMSEVDAQEKKQDEELRRNRELEQEAVSRYRKAADLEYHKKLATIKVAIELQKEQFYKAQQIQAAKKRVMDRDEEIRRNNAIVADIDVSIKEHDDHINRLETQLFDDVCIDALHSLNREIPKQDLQSIIDRCKHKNNPDFDINDTVEEIAKVLQRDITSVIDCFRDLGKDQVFREIGEHKGIRKKLKEKKEQVNEKTEIFKLANTIDKEFISTSTSPAGLVSDVEHDLVTRAIEENPELNSMSRKEINLQIKESALEEIVEEKPNRINELEKVLSQLKIDEKQFQSELDDVNTKLDDPNTDEKLLDDLIALQTDLEDKLKTCQSQQGIAEDEIKFFQSNPEELKNQLNEAWNKNVGNIGIIAPRPSWMKHREENKLSPAKNEEALSENEDKFGETNDL